MRTGSPRRRGSRNGSVSAVARAHCIACGHALSRYSHTCPRCGTPQPHKRLGGAIALLVLIFGLVAYLIHALLIG